MFTLQFLDGRSTTKRLARELQSTRTQTLSPPLRFSLYVFPVLTLSPRWYHTDPDDGVKIGFATITPFFSLRLTLKLPDCSRKRKKVRAEPYRRLYLRSFPFLFLHYHCHYSLYDILGSFLPKGFLICSLSRS